MILIYILKKYFYSLTLSFFSSFSIFFIFSLLGNLSEKISFHSIIFLSFLNVVQIFTYIPSYLFAISVVLCVIFLKNKNELIIIKSYIKIEKLLIISLPLIIIFLLIEINKSFILDKVDYFKSSYIKEKNIKDLKVYINHLDENEKSYAIFKNINQDSKSIEQYLFYQIIDSEIVSGKFNKNLVLKDDYLISKESFQYQNENIENINPQMIIVNNLKELLSEVGGIKIIKEYQYSNFNFTKINTWIFYFLFYLIFMTVFLSKKILNSKANLTKLFIFIFTLFVYYLFIPGINLNNYNIIFHIITTLTLILVFIKVKKNE